MNNKFYLLVKRCFDFCAARMGLLVTSPIWVVTVIGILVSDPGPVFFRATRIGKDNKEFKMWKFRSMRVPKKESEKSEASFKADTDRIFPFGNLIRRLKIDELPQLLNILNGTMAIVGPRPAARDQVETMRSGKYEIAAKVKPGLTGPAALYDYIYGDTIEDLEDYKRLVLPTRLELEAYYPTRMGVGYDIKMIWYTVVCILCSLFHKEPKKIFGELTSCVNPENAEIKETASVR